VVVVTYVCVCDSWTFRSTFLVPLPTRCFVVCNEQGIDHERLESSRAVDHRTICMIGLVAG